MPAADSANSRPMKSSRARTALAAILRSDRLVAVAPLMRLTSMAEEIHSATTSTTIADSDPSITLRKVMRVVPKVQWTSSAPSRRIGSTPVTHSATAIQASHDTVRSIERMALDAGNAAPSTRTVKRIATSETSTGMATRKTPGGTPSDGSSARAP